ncbi:MAG: DUF1573 domain-containing protein [Bacteroidetes bacterium]|nr:MAG: DUF1573 domain-containing protein [Bacteroidota bacterium]
MKKLVVLFTFLFVASFVFAQTKPVASGKTPIAQWSKTTHDFGTIVQNVPVTTTFTVKNTGKAPLIISQVNPSCGCTTPSYTRELIMPGKTGEVKAQFNAQASGAFSKTLSVVTNSSNEPNLTLTIKGNVSAAGTNTGQ